MKKYIFYTVYAIFMIVFSALVLVFETPERAIASLLWSIICFLAILFIKLSGFSYKTDVSRRVNIVKLKENATIPTRGSEEAAGYDLYACIDSPLTIEPHETVMVPTGIAVELPRGTYAGIYARSGLASKKGLRPANCVGVCDSDYRGEYMVALHNDKNEVKTIEPNERIAQMIVHKYERVNFNLVDKLKDTNRGSGGFGSTGK